MVMLEMLKAPRFEDINVAQWLGLTPRYANSLVSDIFPSYSQTQDGERVYAETMDMDKTIELFPSFTPSSALWLLDHTFHALAILFYLN